MYQGAHCYVLLKKLLPSAVVSKNLPNALSMHQLGNLSVTNQAQVTVRGFSYKAVFFSSAVISGEKLHCSKRFAVVHKEGPSEGLSEKEPAPPPPEIQNSSAPPYAPEDPIEAGVFNASNWTEDIALVRNRD